MPKLFSVFVHEPEGDIWYFGTFSSLTAAEKAVADADIFVDDEVHIVEGTLDEAIQFALTDTDCADDEDDMPA